MNRGNPEPEPAERDASEHTEPAVKWIELDVSRVSRVWRRAFLLGVNVGFATCLAIFVITLWIKR